MVLLDTSAEINMIIQEIIQDINLAIKQGFKLELVSYTSHSRSFFSFYEDVKVVIGEFKIRYQIFIVEAGDHDFILG